MTNFFFGSESGLGHLLSLLFCLVNPILVSTRCNDSTFVKTLIL